MTKTMKSFGVIAVAVADGDVCVCIDVVYSADESCVHGVVDDGMMMETAAIVTLSMMFLVCAVMQKCWLIVLIGSCCWRYAC